MAKRNPPTPGPRRAGARAQQPRCHLRACEGGSPRVLRSRWHYYHNVRAAAHEHDRSALWRHASSRWGRRSRRPAMTTPRSPRCDRDTRWSVSPDRRSWARTPTSSATGPCARRRLRRSRWKCHERLGYRRQCVQHAPSGERYAAPAKSSRVNRSDSPMTTAAAAAQAQD